MLHLRTIAITSIMISTLFSCAKPDSEPSASDLNGIWTMEKINSNAQTQLFTKTYYNVHIKDDGENVVIMHCNTDRDMRFVRDANDLNSSNDDQLRIVSGTIIESINVEDIIQITRTKKDNFFNAGRIQLESDIIGTIDTSSGTCARKIVKSTDAENFQRFVFSVPFNDNAIEITLEFFLLDDGSIDTVTDFSLNLNSPLFRLSGYYGEYSIRPDFINSISANVTGSTASIDFDFNTRSYATTEYTNIAGDNITGNIQVRF